MKEFKRKMEISYLLLSILAVLTGSNFAAGYNTIAAVSFVFSLITLIFMYVELYKYTK